MPAVHIALERTTPTGTAPATGSVEIAPLRRTIVGVVIVTTAQFTQRLTGGQATVTLAPGYWRIVETAHPRHVRYVQVPDVPGPVEYSTLVDVDPHSLDPEAEPDPVWQLALDELRADVDALSSPDWDDIDNRPTVFPPSAHSHAVADITGLVATLTGKADLVGGKIPTSQIPSISTHETVPVASKTAMLALTTSQVQPGDIAVIGSTGAAADRGLWLLTATDPSVIGSWLKLDLQSGVTTVQGQSGVVVLGAADVGALAAASNLSDLASTSAARGNLGLGDAATKSVGTGAGTVAAGDDSRFGGVPLMPRTPSGFYVGPAGASPPGGVQSIRLANGRVLYSYIVVPVETTFNQIAQSIPQNGSAGSVVRLGVYANTGGKPGALLLDAGTADTSAGGYLGIACSLTLQPGIYWVAVAAQGSPATNPGVQYVRPAYSQALTQDDIYTPTCGWSTTGVTGPFADNPTVIVSNEAASVRLRAA